MKKMLFIFMLMIIIIPMVSLADQTTIDMLLNEIKNIKTVDEVKVTRDKVIDFISKEPKLDYENDYKVAASMIIKEIRIVNDKESINKIYQIMIDKYKYSDSYSLGLMLERDRIYFKNKVPSDFIEIEIALLQNIEADSMLKILRYHENIAASILMSDYKNNKNLSIEMLEYVINSNISKFIFHKKIDELANVYNDAAVRLVGILSDSDIKKMGLDIIAFDSVCKAFPEKSKLINWSNTPNYNNFLWILSKWLNEAIKENETDKEFVGNFSAVYKYLEDEKFKRGMIDEKKLPITVANRTKMLTTKNINKEADTLYHKSVINFAVISGDIELVKMLLDKGINIDVKDTDGKLPIDYANENVKNKVAGSEKIAALLTEYMKRK